jgi:GT2 family glycosyltransferase
VVASFPPDVEVGVVSHNGRVTLPSVFEHLVESGAPLDRIVLYDIGSTDDTLTWMAQTWPQVTVRPLEGNVGPNPARNRALTDATLPFVLLVDSDALVAPDAPARLREALDPAAQVGVVTPVVVQAQAPTLIQYAGASLHFVCEAVNPWFDRPAVDRGLERQDIGTAPGVVMLVDVAAARHAGLFDNQFFMGKEDGDFCYRLRLSGFRLVEEPRAVVAHPNRARTSWLFSYQIRNRWYFMLKNYEARTLVVLAPALLIHEGVQFAMLTAKGHLGAWWTAVKSLWAWLPSLSNDRRAVREARAVHDRDLLVAAPLVVRADLVGGSAGQVVKRAYDSWLAFYWRVARTLLA